ncbi:MAG: thioredoxin domain-containing protein [Nitrospiraceae bacterium]|nr:MAG: thioredoxin domain-containing protein [Nitrospiraceae bacterium]
MNRLSKEKSAYLKHSEDQKIDWYPWSEKAFEKAQQEDKPLFLSSGAVWCHWCHVMARESFYDDELAQFLNQNFICIKLDRDERPDIDRRYQLAVAAMGSGGGWPLSVFLTYDKKPFYGGTYFPPEDRFGKPGFRKVLNAITELYKTKRDEITNYTNKLSDALKPEPSAARDIKESFLEEAVTDILSEVDLQNGGFGSAPKFPMAGALEFLIGRYSLIKSETIGLAVRKTLEAMALGGFYDQIGGGFHRYSTDKAWVIPHFEKMADDNAWLLRNYVHAYSVFGDKLFRDVAEGTMEFISQVLSDPDGGFYASQDADVIPDDEGGYFTWTDEDFRRILNEDEYRVLSLHLMNEMGSMHHDATKKVLFTVMDEKEIARQTAKDKKEVGDIIKRGKKKLFQERNRRQTPFIDRTLYTSINGMLISSFLLYSRVFRDDRAKNFAIKSLDRILKIRFVGGQLFHTDGVNALLDDYIHLVDALILAYEVSADIAYLRTAEEIMGLCIKKLWDEKEGGFFDTDDHLLGLIIKGVEDMPHSSANSLAVVLFLKLHFVTQKEEYLQHAEKILKVFSLRAKGIGIHAGYYFYALDAYFNGLRLAVHALPESELASAAITWYKPYMFISYREDRGYIIPCKKNICYEPLHDPEGLKKFLDKEF